MSPAKRVEGCLSFIEVVAFFAVVLVMWTVATKGYSTREAEEARRDGLMWFLMGTLCLLIAGIILMAEHSTDKAHKQLQLPEPVTGAC